MPEKRRRICFRPCQKLSAQNRLALPPIDMMIRQSEVSRSLETPLPRESQFLMYDSISNFRPNDICTWGCDPCLQRNLSILTTPFMICAEHGKLCCHNSSRIYGMD